MRLNRKDFGSNREFFDALLDKEFEWAKDQRGAVPYGDDFKMRITVIGPQYQTARLPYGWSSNEEKYDLMHRVAYLARAISATGVMIASDTRFVKSEDFEQHFKLTPAKVSGIDAYMSEYHRIMKRFDGSIANLPRHLWSEAINVGLKTEEFGDLCKMETYTRGSGRYIMWVPNDQRLDGGRFEISMLDNWWEIKDDDPKLLHAVEIAENVTREILGALRSTTQKFKGVPDGTN